jgi:hypothetical protein
LVDFICGVEMYFSRQGGRAYTGQVGIDETLTSAKVYLTAVPIVKPVIRYMAMHRVFHGKSG